MATFAETAAHLRTAADRIHPDPPGKQPTSYGAALADTRVDIHAKAELAIAHQLRIDGHQIAGRGWEDDTHNHLTALEKAGETEKIRALFRAAADLIDPTPNQEHP